MKAGAGVLGVVLLVSGSVASAAPPEIISVQVSAGAVDAVRLRAAVARELAMTAVAPEDPRAASAGGRLTIVVVPSEKTLTVSFRRGDAAGAPVTRTVALPDTPARVESSAVILAGNVARDQASDVLEALRKPRASAPPTTVKAQGPRPPTAREIDGLATLQDQVAAYDKGARQYREALTDIVRLHYETKKHAVLSGLDREIAVEQSELRKARATAIRRLEEFIAAHEARLEGGSGGEVPDAMYRLASLYEERAQATEEGDAAGLSDAIRLYKRILREYPTYRETAAVFYFLGHALSDAGRLPESQQVWRSLVCHNHFDYPTAADTRDPDRDVVRSMPQDGDGRSPPSALRSEMYIEVYPQDCTALPQPSRRPGEGPKYVAEVWWQIGNWEFDQLDFAAGPWAYPRAASAYVHAIRLAGPPIYGVSLYKYAWTLFKQQRYEAATRAFVDLLLYTDEQERRTGDRGADFRSEAYTYIAGSLTSVDFKGPPASAPFVLRQDDLAGAEDKLRVALGRVSDPRLIPQDKAWTIEIYRAVATELRGLDAFGLAVEVYGTTLQRWPLDPSAPETESAIAETYDQLAAASRSSVPGSNGERDAAQKALDARTKLANYVGSTPWVDANKDRPTAIQNAERLAHGGLRHAAVQHTNYARAALEAADATKDAGRRVELVLRAASEYKLAAQGWSGWVAQQPDDGREAPETYEGQYWNADARHKYVRLEQQLHELAPTVHREPGASDIDAALAAALVVRDSREDDRYLDNAAFFVVDLSDVRRDLAYARHAAVATEGVAKREDVSFDGTAPRTRNVVKQPIPPVVAASMNARDAYAELVPPERDVMKRALVYRYAVAETYFLYGEWELARERFDAIWKSSCGVDAYGFKAWERLLTMATKGRDEARAMQLLDAVDPKKGGKSCDAAAERQVDGPIRTEALYERARRRLAEACETRELASADPCKDPGDPKKKPIWRDVARLYEEALAASGSSPAPDEAARDEAADGALNAAYAYNQAGEPARAVALYEKVLAEYDSSGGRQVRARDAERVKVVGQAYDALVAAYSSAFDYPKTAATYERMSRSGSFDEPKRRDAAKSSLALYASIGERDRTLAMRRELDALHPSLRDLAEADYQALSFDYKRWDAKARGDAVAAEAALVRYYEKYRVRPVVPRLVVEVAHAVARMKRANGETDSAVWLARTVAAWDDFRAREGHEAQKAPYVDHAAEAAFTLLDDAIAAKFDAAAVHSYPARSALILGDPATPGRPGKFQLNAEEASRWDLRLEREVVRKFESVPWVITALARQGAIFDALRTGLYDVTRPTLFSPAEEALLRKLQASGQGGRASALADAAQDVWRTRKQKELDAADEVMVRRYATAVAYARAYNVASPAVVRASARLAYYTDLLGDAKLGSYVGRTLDPTDPTGKTTLTYRERMYERGRAGVAASAPAPVGQAGAQPIAP